VQKLLLSLFQQEYTVLYGNSNAVAGIDVTVLNIHMHTCVRDELLHSKMLMC